MKKNLKPIQVSQDIFERILKYFDGTVEEIDNLNDFKTGYSKKDIIYRKDKELICLAYWLNYTVKSEVIPWEQSWRQIIVRCDGGLNPNTWTDDITGPQALKQVKKIISKKYSKKEYETILKEHESDYNDDLKQQHLIEVQPYIQKFEDCYYYDINGAHTSAWAEMFPRCYEEFNEIHNTRHDNDGYNKKIANYSIGQLCKNGHRKTYNWVVQRTTKILADFDNKRDGLPIYINTDGIIYTNLRNPCPGSNKMGQFKREHGTVYTYRADNYYILLFIDDEGNKTYKGTLPIVLRDKLDLEHGIVVKYKRAKINRHYEYLNVEEIQL